ncbi:MAG: ABC transporter permease [Pseudomonadota bacterium]
MPTTSEVRVQATKIAQDASQLEELRDRPGFFSEVMNMARKQPLGTFGALVVIAMVIAAALAPLVAPFDPEENSLEFMLTAPNATHWLGTDEFGRDVLSRIIYGAQTALFVGLVSSFVGAIIGLVLGVASAFFGGRIDLILQRILDVFMAFPLIIIALTVVVASRSLFPTAPPEVQVIFVVIAITIPFIPRCARVVRSSALAIREIPYIDAARANGYSNSRIIMRHMVPNVMAPFLIMITAFVGQAILLEASLSFLGLGVQEPTPAWGLMLRSAQEHAETSPWTAIWPGVAITLAVFGFNMFGDAVRDALDPKLRSNQ